MQHANSILNLLAAASGLIAAWYWFWSATIKYPNHLEGGWTFAGASISTSPLLEAVQESGRLNKIAAIFTGIAALFASIAAFLTGC